MAIISAFSYFFFFSSRRRHTRSYGDWSSDVCSSDLVLARAHQPEVAKPEILERPHHMGDVDEILGLVQNDGDHYLSPEANKCGMRNSECGIARRGSIAEASHRVRRARGSFRNPHSAFRISFIPPAPRPRTAPAPGDRPG